MEEIYIKNFLASIRWLTTKRDLRRFCGIQKYQVPKSCWFCPGRLDNGRTRTEEGGISHPSMKMRCKPRRAWVLQEHTDCGCWRKLLETVSRSGFGRWGDGCLRCSWSCSRGGCWQWECDLRPSGQTVTNVYSKWGDHGRWWPWKFSWPDVWGLLK